MDKGKQMPQSILCVLLLFGMLSGCSTNIDYPKPTPRTQGALIGVAGGATIGAIASGNAAGTVVGGVLGCAIGSAIGDTIQRHQTLPEQLQAQHIQIIEVGDTVKVVIPTDDYFIGNSPKINPNYYPVLNKVATYIRPIPKESIRVAGFTDNSECQMRALGLSRDRARALAAYLWSQNLDARLIYPVGYGANEPIACNTLESGRAKNRRMEITFWRITHDDEF